MKKWNAQTLACIPLGIGVLVLAAALLVDDLDSPAGEEFLARGFAVCWFTALIVWTSARNRTPEWSWARYIWAYFVLALFFSGCLYINYLEKTGELKTVIQRMQMDGESETSSTH
jgi:hypothetical protein